MRGRVGCCEVLKGEGGGASFLTRIEYNLIFEVCEAKWFWRLYALILTLSTATYALEIIS